MRFNLGCLLVLLCVWNIDASPLPLDSPIWRKLTKRDAAAVAAQQENQANATIENSAADEKINHDADDEVLEAVNEENQFDNEPNKDDDSNQDRSIDWQLLSGNPNELQQDLDMRRRRRSTSLNRQHRIRTVGHRSRSKRSTYDQLDPADLELVYEYLQQRRQPQQVPDQLDPVSDEELADLASLIYELQQPNDQQEDEDQLLPIGYVELDADDQEPQYNQQDLAELEEALSDQAEEPKDKRSAVDEEEDGGDQQEAVYVIPITVEQPPEYVQLPLSAGYDNPYNYYQIDNPIDGDEAERRYGEEQLRERIADLIDEINQQRQYNRRR